MVSKWTIIRLSYNQTICQSTQSFLNNLINSLDVNLGIGQLANFFYQFALALVLVLWSMAGGSNLVATTFGFTILTPLIKPEIGLAGILVGRSGSETCLINLFFSF